MNGPGTRHEPALLAVLDDRVPDLVPELLARRPRREGGRWAGTPGRCCARARRPDGLWAAWEAVVPRYAEAQIALARRTATQLLATGVPEVVPATLPGLARANCSTSWPRTARPGAGWTRRRPRRLGGGLPALRRVVRRAGRGRVPDSVQHDDLHSANVCWTGSAARGPDHRLGRRLAGAARSAPCSPR